MADNFNLKQFLAENKLGAYSRIKEVDEAKGSVSKEQKIQVIKEWIWYTCDEGQAKDDINKYNKMVDMYFAGKDDVTKQDFKNIWNKVIEKYGVGDVGADSEAFPETWADIQTGTLVNPGQTYEAKEEGYMGTQYDSSEDMAVDMIKKGVREDIGGNIGDAEAEKEMDFLAEYEVIYQREGNKCYRVDDEGNRDEVNLSYCQRFAEGKEEKEESINERLAPHVFSRMAGLSNYKAQMAMIKAAEILMRDLTEEGFEVEEVREFFTQLIANDI